MSAAGVRGRIEAVWDRLPVTFRVNDVLQLVGRSRNKGRLVREVLDALVGEGRLVVSIDLESCRLGRRPRVWSKVADRGVREVMVEAVRAVLSKVPRIFDLADLSGAIGVSGRGMRKLVREALRQLEDEGVVISVRNLSRRRRGPRAECWSADCCVIAQEREVQARIEKVREERKEALKRLFGGWRPFER